MLVCIVQLAKTRSDEWKSPAVEDKPNCTRDNVHLPVLGCQVSVQDIRPDNVLMTAQGSGRPHDGHTTPQ